MHMNVKAGGHKSLLRSKLLLALVMAGVCLSAAKPVGSQAKNDLERKVVTRVEPEYPETLKRLYIGGVVRLQVIVSAAGNVENVQLIGGNPILGQSALKAIKQWKFAPNTGKTTFVIPLTFDPHQ
jgi:TonB family protein